MTRLDRLFRPKSLAVIGGGAWGAAVIEEARKLGFGGPIWPVHPAKKAVAGEPCFRHVDDLPQAPDAVFVGVNRAATIETTRALSALGAGGAVCFASGFRESEAETGDGQALEAALLDAAGEMPILGPNCYGFLNLLDGVSLWPDQHGATRCKEGVAILSQSSNLAINLTMQARALPLAYVVTVGNQAQTGLSEIGQALLEDPRVTALGLYIEGVGDLAMFEALTHRARALGKPIVALKAGASEAAQLATLSHTASLAGSADSASALFARLGVVEVRSLPVLLECLKLLHHVGPLPSAEINSLSCSGGEASLVADLAAPRGLRFPPLTPGQEAGLRATLGPKVALANPLDYHTYIWADMPAMTACYAAMMQGAAPLTLLLLDWPHADRCDGAAWDLALEAAAQAAKQTGKPLAIVSTIPETLPEPLATRCADLGLVPLAGLETALDAIAAAVAHPVPEAAPIWHGPTPVGEQVLQEGEAKAALAPHGVALPKAVRANSPDQAAELAGHIGLPVALKGTGAAHKTEAGLVALDLTSPKAVLEAAHRMECGSFLVEEMIPSPVAELLIGVTRDPAHGLMLTLGAGGYLTELWRDATHLLLPVTRDDILTALDRLRIAPLLHGYRGQPAANLTAIAETVLAIQDYVAAHRDRLLEVEINPLFCLPDRAIAVDALIRLGDPP